jgi:hypothetical protein
MTVLIGVDEAGYGPNLGPLVVAATAWQIDLPDTAALGELPDLYDHLSGAVSVKPRPDRIAIADSKQLYKPRGGLHHLERGVLGSIGLLPSASCGTWQQLLAATHSSVPLRDEALPWHTNYDPNLPRDADPRDLTRATHDLKTCCADAGVRLIAMRARLVFPAELNDLIDDYQTKGAALSHVTLQLVREIHDETVKRVPTAEGCLRPSAQIVCDKHGGRNRYAGLLQHHFPEPLVQALRESRRESCYRWPHPKTPLEIRFQTGGERFLPAALASMTAKYLRELAMAAFNGFWRDQLPHLRPTAGYPVDAVRFREEIATRQKELAISGRILWRNR